MLYVSVADVPNAKSALNTCKADKSMEPSTIQFVEEYLTNVEEQIEEDFIEAYNVGKPFSQPDADDESAPEQFGLSQNFPNPGNPTTSIQFSLPESGHVMLKITNLMGQEVKTLVDENRQAGSYSVVWDGKDSNGVEMPSGIYIYTLHVGDKVFTRKLTLMK
jgi:flagellar hook assembly protein FlgD